MNHEATETEQKEQTFQLLTISQIDLLADKESIPGVKGFLKKLEPRKGKTSRRPFYIGYMTDRTGQMRVTFFRQDMEEFAGHVLKITSNYKGKGLRKDSYKGDTEMTVFSDAHIFALQEEPEVIQELVNNETRKQAAQYHDPKFLACPGQTIGTSANFASRIIAALVSNPSMSDPVQWLYSENFTQMVDRIMSISVDAVRKQETNPNRQ